MTEHKGWYRRRLPHRDEPGLIQAITFRLADSLPTALAMLMASDSDAEADRRARTQRVLDEGAGSCLLGDPRVAQIVEGALLAGDGTRYVLLAWVVMPNHVHVLIETLGEWSLARIVQSWKGSTARQANVVLGRQGRFWAREYFDRYIRDEDHLQRAVLYVHNNPVKAGLVAEPAEWRFGSARRMETVDSMFHALFDRREG
jgi:putative DNA methylase